MVENQAGPADVEMPQAAADPMAAPPVHPSMGPGWTFNPTNFQIFSENVLEMRQPPAAASSSQPQPVTHIHVDRPAELPDFLVSPLLAGIMTRNSQQPSVPQPPGPAFSGTEYTESRFGPGHPMHHVLQGVELAHRRELQSDGGTHAARNPTVHVGSSCPPHMHRSLANITDVEVNNRRRALAAKGKGKGKSEDNITSSGFIYTDNTCPICFDEYSRGEMVYRMPCGHVYHITCWNEIRRRSTNDRTCSVCRAPTAGMSPPYAWFEIVPPAEVHRQQETFHTPRQPPSRSTGQPPTASSP